MTEGKLDELMKNVLWDSIRLESDVISRTDLKFVPSPAYEAQIRRMLADPNGWAKRNETPMWKMILQKAAIILLALSITLGGMMAVSEEVRATVIRWIRDQFQGTIFYEYFGDDVSDQIPHFTIGNLPEGYVEVERVGTSAAESVKYKNQMNGEIWFSYYFVQQGGTAAIVPEDDVIYKIKINETDGELYIPQNPENMKMIHWIDTKENIHYFIHATVEENILLEMAENIFEKK